MKLWWILPVAVSVEIIGAAYSIGKSHGEIETRHEIFDAQECGCNEWRSCAFGPGVIGEQHCQYNRTWSRCEPDPRYRTEARP